MFRAHPKTSRYCGWALRALIAAFILIMPLTASAEFHLALEDYGLIEAADPSQSPLNPGNRVLQIPSLSAQNDLRPDLKFNTERTRWVLRPRWVFSGKTWIEDSDNRELSTIVVPQDPGFTSSHKNKYGQDYAPPPQQGYPQP